jgi:uncharacterized protein YqgV (UPF0045/DUF77 family)
MSGESGSAGADDGSVITAQVSVYPLRQAQLGASIELVVAALRCDGVEVREGPMSTLVRGEARLVFAALRDGFERAAAQGDVVMVLTVSNACPGGER